MWSKLLVIIGFISPLLQLTSAQGIPCRTPDNKNGMCISIKACKPLLTMLQTQGVAAGDYLRASLCHYRDSDPVVCCPMSGVNDVDDRADENEIRYTPYGPLQPPDCGFTNASHTKVVGGEPSQLGAWPWIAALGYHDKKNPSRPKWLCGGSLVSRRHILTAGHCVYQRNDLYVVRLGDLVLNSDSDGANPIDVLIEKKTVHPRYSATNFVNDVAVLRLEKEIPFSLNIHPICLPVADEVRTKNYVGTYPFVAGWGSVEYKGPVTNHLREVQLPVVDMNSCKSSFTKFKNVIINDRVMCAGYAQGGKDACQGDSGGPLMSAQKGYRYYIIGIVSFGFQCAEPGYPGIYTRVTEFLGFITDQLR